MIYLVYLSTTLLINEQSNYSCIEIIFMSIAIYRVFTVVVLQIISIRVKNRSKYLSKLSKLAGYFENSLQ